REQLSEPRGRIPAGLVGRRRRMVEHLPCGAAQHDVVRTHVPEPLEQIDHPGTAPCPRIEEGKLAEQPRSDLICCLELLPDGGARAAELLAGEDEHEDRGEPCY